MEIVRGSVVKAKAGRDKGDFFVVLDFDGLYATICNGKRRSIENPKRKKCIHLSPSGTVLNVGSMCTNREIRKALSEFINKT